MRARARVSSTACRTQTLTLTLAPTLTLSPNQAEHYLTHGYTEYIELRIPEPMYV